MRRGCGSVGLLVVVTCALIASSHAFTIDLRALVLSIPGFTNTDFLETVLNGTGAPYDVLRWVNNPGASMNATLFKAPGQPRYSTIFMYPNLDLDSTLTAAQVADLDAYRAQYGVRMVRFGAWLGNFGYTPLTVGVTGSQTLTFQAAMPFGISGIKNVTLDVNGMYRVPATLASGTPVGRWCSNAYVARQCNATTLATLAPNSALGTGYGSTTIAGAIITYSNGMVEQVWNLDMAAWITNALVFAHLTVDWGFHSMIPGMRRVLLSTQVDDVFLSTEWCTNAAKTYRLSAADMQAHQGWMGLVNAGLPNSSYIVDMVFNGNGALEPFGANTDTPAGPALSQDWDFACVDDPLYATYGCNCALLVQSACTSTNQWCLRCTKDWKMPAGWGSDNIVSTYGPSKWPTLATLQGDALNKAVSNNATNLNSFIWTSHTFSHHNLHNATINDTLKQWSWNQQMANLMKISTSTKYNPKGVVTPGISGLTNVNNLKNLISLGYTSAVGDNTYNFLRNVQRPHWTLPLTLAVNNLDSTAFRIIPRQATEIYFCASDINDEVTQYNLLYQSYFGFASTISQIMSREVDRVLRSTILGLYGASHMFHQANMALKTWPAGSGVTGSKSLLMVWVERVVAAAKAYTSWPIETLKQDDLLNWFLERENRDRCGLTYTLTVTDTTKIITGYTITSTGATTGTTCKAPLLVPTAATVAGSTLGPVTSSGAQHRLVSVAPNAVVSGTITGATW